MKSVFVFCLAFVMFIACTEKSSAPNQETRRKNIPITMTSDTCHIAIDSGYTFYYKKYTSSDSLYIGYNSMRHSLDVFDYVNSVALKRIQLFTEGPNAVEDVAGLYFKQQDSIFILTQTQLTILNFQGQKIFSMPVNEANQEQEIFTDYFAYGGNEANNLLYDAKEKSVYVQALDVKYGQCRKEHYDKLLYKINIQTQKAELMLFQYAEQYRDNYFGFFQDFEFTQSNDKLLTVFPVLSSLFIFNLTDNSTQVIGGEPSVGASRTDLLDWQSCNVDDVKMRHYVENVQFHKLIYDSYRDLYYRFHHGDAKSKKADGTFKTINDKDQMLTVFNSSFEIIEEIKLDDRRYPILNVFVGQKGLYINAPINENCLRFRILKFSTNE